MTIIPARFSSLKLVDALIIVFIQLLSVIGLSLVTKSPWATLLIPINIAATIGIINISRAASRSKMNFFRALHDWYPVPTIFFIFKEVHVIIQSLGRHDWDNVFIIMDRTIFGVDPTVWLAKFSSPLQTELLQISYASYYFIMLAVGIELYFTNERQKFSYTVFTIVFGFVLSYIGYILFPAIGPRFTLHDFSAINSDLPGMWLTNYIRDFINAGESIPKDAINAIAIAQRDVFPSGHTQMTLISLHFAYHYKLKSRYALFVFGILLIISTVYLRYHYVIDVLGGILFVWITLWSAPKLYEWWDNFRETFGGNSIYHNR